ncbi:MAG: hypothetical protein ACRDQH_15360 [Pseudonocardiaceae bacterium]
MQEALAALGLEGAGQLPGPVRRDATGAADFIDGRGKLWDAEVVNPTFPASRGGHYLATSSFKIGRKLLIDENVIIITDDLSAEGASDLKTAVDSVGLSDHVLF